jgi:hypothetical protein
MLIGKRSRVICTRSSFSHTYIADDVVNRA